jgi:hypothetical protein
MLRLPAILASLVIGASVSTMINGYFVYRSYQEVIAKDQALLKMLHADRIAHSEQIDDFCKKYYAIILHQAGPVEDWDKRCNVEATNEPSQDTR